MHVASEVEIEHGGFAAGGKKTDGEIKIDFATVALALFSHLPPVRGEGRCPFHGLVVSLARDPAARPAGTYLAIFSEAGRSRSDAGASPRHPSPPDRG